MDVKFIDRRHAVLCSNSETLRVINYETRSEQLLQAHDSLVTAVDVFKSRFMITGSKDGKVLLWRITNNAQQDHEGPSQGIVDDNDDEQTEQDHRESCALNAAHRGLGFRLIKQYQGHTGSVSSLSFAQRTGAVFVSTGTEGFVKLWNLRLKTCKTLRPFAKEANFVRISPDERLLMTGSHERHLKFYHTKDLSLAASVDAHVRGMWDGDFAPVERFAATGSSDMTVKVWDYSSV